jgi:outer membrane lipoprotein-sorting protein
MNLSISNGKGSGGLRRAAMQAAVAFALALVVMALPRGFASAGYRKPKVAPPLGEILARMNDAAKRLKTVSANIEYTKVTVVVNDKAVESGEFFFRKGKSAEILLNYQKPDPKVFLYRKNKGEIYLPKSNQIQEYNLEKQGGMVEQFLLLGFGTETGDLQKAYTIKLNGEEVLDGDTTALLELTPRRESVAAQLSKVQLWISEESWIPVQQKLVEASGDYHLMRYTAVIVNRELPASTFRIPAPADAKRVKMN